MRRRRKAALTASLTPPTEPEEEDGRCSPAQTGGEASPGWREASQMFELLRSRAAGGAGLVEQGWRRSRAAASSRSEDLIRTSIRTISAGLPASSPADRPGNWTCSPVELQRCGGAEVWRCGPVELPSTTGSIISSSVCSAGGAAGSSQLL